MDAVITGGCNALGELFAKSLGDEGYRVISTTRSARKAREFSEKPAYDECQSLDLGDFNAIADFFSEKPDVRVLVNLAVARFPIKDNEAYTWEEWERELRINLGACYRCSVEAAKSMKTAGFGRVINTGSIYGQVAVDHRIYPEDMAHTHIIYSTSKAAIIHMTREMASMWAGDSITVNCLSFGGVEAGQPEDFKREYSRKVPMGRLGCYDELVPAFEFLIARDNSYFTGQNVMVDGGFNIW